MHNNEHEDNINKYKFEDLSTDFSEEEVSKCLHTLQNKKTPGDDLITNKMI